MFRQIQYSWQSYDPLYFSFPKHDFMSNVPVYPSEYLLMVLMLKTLLELTFIPLTLHFFQNKNLRKKKTTINLFTSQVLSSSQRCLLSLNFMQIKTSSKDPTDYANGLEKQELQQQVKKGRSLVTENPAPKRASPSAKGRGHAPTATPTPGLLHPPKPPWSGTKRRGGNADSALLLQGDLGHASSVSSSGKWGQAFMAASTRAVGSGLSSPKFQGNYGPLPTRLPAAAPRRPPAPFAPTRATCDLGDERFRHQRHGGCEALDARLRSAALGSLPRDLGGSHAVHEPRWLNARTRRNQLTRRGPARKVTARPALDFRRRWQRAPALPAAPPRALRTRVSPGRSASVLSRRFAILLQPTKMETSWKRFKCLVWYYWGPETQNSLSSTTCRIWGPWTDNSVKYLFKCSSQKEVWTARELKHYLSTPCTQNETWRTKHFNFLFLSVKGAGKGGH